MFSFGQYGTVSLEFVFFEEFLSTSDLDVEKGVSHAKDGVGHCECDGEQWPIIIFFFAFQFYHSSTSPNPGLTRCHKASVSMSKYTHIYIKRGFSGSLSHSPGLLGRGNRSPYWEVYFTTGLFSLVIFHRFWFVCRSRCLNSLQWHKWCSSLSGALPKSIGWNRKSAARTIRTRLRGMIHSDFPTLLRTAISIV